MNDHDTPDAAYRRLLEVARARLKNHPDLLRSFEHEHTMRRVCGFLAVWAATDSPSMLAPDARLCRIVDEWVQAWKQPLAAGRPIRVQPLDARPEQTASPAPSASAPPTADTPAPAPSASAPTVAPPEAVPDGKPEAVEARQGRRLLELRSMGADCVPHGVGWRVAGKRGALAALVRREAGQPMGTKDGVRKDLRAAVQRESGRNGRLSR